MSKVRQILSENLLAFIYLSFIAILVLFISIMNFSDNTDWLYTNELGDLLAGIFAPLAFFYLVKGQKDLAKASREQSKEIKRQMEIQELNERYKSWQVCQKILKDLSFVIAKKYSYLFRCNAFSDFAGKKLSTKIGDNHMTNPEGHHCLEILIAEIVEHMTKNLTELTNNRIDDFKDAPNTLISLYNNYVNILENFIDDLDSKNQKYKNLKIFIKGSLEHTFYEAIKEQLKRISQITTESFEGLK
jgi:hypothetical protein